MQKQLKEEEGLLTMVYSFETDKERYEARIKPFFEQEEHIIFFGTKTELKELGEEFWKPLVEGVIFEYQVPVRVSGVYWAHRFKNYIDPSFEKGGCETAKESGLSAIEECKEFIIITQETK